MKLMFYTALLFCAAFVIFKFYGSPESGTTDRLENHSPETPPTAVQTENGPRRRPRAKHYPVAYETSSDEKPQITATDQSSRLNEIANQTSNSETSELAGALVNEVGSNSLSSTSATPRPPLTPAEIANGCSQNLRMISEAALQFANDHNRKLPSFLGFTNYLSEPQFLICPSQGIFVSTNWAEFDFSKIIYKMPFLENRTSGESKAYIICPIHTPHFIFNDGRVVAPKKF
jgi:hypothetical protein